MKNNKSLIALLILNTLTLLAYYFDTEYHFLGEIGQNALCFLPGLFNIIVLRQLILNKEKSGL